MPKVSVIIPTYNMSRFISDAVESVLNQTYQDYEIIIVDDGSTDGTKAIVKKHIDQCPDKVRYIYQENKGLAVARNTAIKNAGGEFIALLDADDKYCSHRLEEGIKVIESHQHIGLVHANVTRISEEGEHILTPKRNKRVLSGYIFNDLFIRKADISCPTVLLRKECFDRVGLFDENLTRLGCEDREAWLRIAREYKVEYIDEVLAYYRYVKSGMSKNREKMTKARYYVVDKFYLEQTINKTLRRVALGNIHRELGDELLYESRYEESRSEYLKSLLYWPFSFWPWVNLTKALLKMKVQSKS